MGAKVMFGEKKKVKYECGCFITQIIKIIDDHCNFKIWSKELGI